MYLVLLYKTTIQKFTLLLYLFFETISHKLILDEINFNLQKYSLVIFKISNFI